MRPARTLPPTAAPVGAAALLAALRAVPRGGASAMTIETELAEYLGVRHTFLLSSGKAALTLLLQALKSLRPGRSVAIPAFTCFSVPAAVVKAGLRPVLVDVDPRTFDFESASLARAFEDPDLLAIVPTHLFGLPADLTRLRRLRGTGPAFIVEDAAQALGVQSSTGRRVGGGGDAAIFSLGRGKHLSAGGGGFIATDDLEIALQRRGTRGGTAGADRARVAWSCRGDGRGRGAHRSVLVLVARRLAVSWSGRNRVLDGLRGIAPSPAPPWAP